MIGVDDAEKCCIYSDYSGQMESSNQLLRKAFALIYIFSIFIRLADSPTMIILYNSIIESIRHQFYDIELIPPHETSNIAGHLQFCMIVNCMTPMAITAEIYPGPLDWITVVRFFSALRSGEQHLFRINENLSNNNLQFAWNKAKTFIITRIDESDLFSVSLTEKPFLIESSMMLQRNEVIDKLVSATLQSNYGRDY